MFPVFLLSPLLLALAVSANTIVVERSTVTLPLSRRLNVTNIHNLVRRDQKRAKALQAKGAAQTSTDLTSRVVINEQVENQAVGYIASVGVGFPPITYSLLIDTGSSNTWLGAGAAYVKTSTSRLTSNSVSVGYGSGSFSGSEYIDQVTLTPGLVIPKQSIGVSSNSTGFDGVDGILGIGPVGLTQGSLSPANSTLIPTVTDNLYSASTISGNLISISFEPTTTDNALNGELTWGGIDHSKYTGSISYTPVTSTSPASYYWGIDQSIRYGTDTIILASTAGIVDTGTTLILLATNCFKAYQTATGAVLDSTTGLLQISAAQYAKLHSLYFTTNGITYELTPNAQIWPRSLNADIGGTVGNIYLIVNDLGSPSGRGLDFINGYGFLERFYSVYDTTNKRVGFAATPYTKAITN